MTKEDHVTSFLTVEHEAKLRQDTYEIATGYDGALAHKQTT